MMRVSTHFQCSLNTAHRHIKAVPTRQGGRNYILSRVSGQPFGLVPDHLACDGRSFFQARRVAIADTGVQRKFMGQELQVYCEADFINVVNELLGLVQDRISLGIYRYEFLNKHRGEFRFRLYASYTIGEEQYRPTALLIVDQGKVFPRKSSWRLRDVMEFTLSVQFGVQQPNTTEELIHYLARYPFVAEGVE